MTFGFNRKKRIGILAGCMLLAACGDGSGGSGADSTDSSATDTTTDSAFDTDSSVDTESDSETVNDSATESDFVISTDPYETDPDNLALGAPCPLDVRIGEFKAESFDDGEIAYVGISGKVTDGVNPVSVMDEAAVEGDCRLLKKRRLICDPACTPGFVCDETETCVPSPLEQDMGTAVLRGLSDDLALSPLQPGFSYSYNKLPYPGSVPGQVIQFTTTDGYLGPLELYGVGVTPLALDQLAVTLQEGQPLSLTWDAPAEPGPVRLSVRLNIDQHGLTPLELICDFPDTGSATISNVLIDQLISAGVTGFPSGSARRRTLDSFTSEAGCVEFIVSSFSEFSVEVAGHTPCIDDSDCELPQTCNLLIQQCE